MPSTPEAVDIYLQTKLFMGLQKLRMPVVLLHQHLK
jgi:hypothetical protein